MYTIIVVLETCDDANCLFLGKDNKRRTLRVECCWLCAGDLPYSRSGKNICSGFAGEGEKKRSNINRNENYIQTPESRGVPAYEKIVLKTTDVWKWRNRRVLFREKKTSKNKLRGSRRYLSTYIWFLSETRFRANHRF